MEHRKHPRSTAISKNVKRIPHRKPEKRRLNINKNLVRKNTGRYTVATPDTLVTIYQAAPANELREDLTALTADEIKQRVNELEPGHQERVWDKIFNKQNNLESDNDTDSSSKKPNKK